MAASQVAGNEMTLGSCLSRVILRELWKRSAGGERDVSLCSAKITNCFSPGSTMRYSEKELLSLALQSPEKEGKILHRMSGTKGRLVEGYKDRLLRLKANFLFLFKTNEQGQILEPVGAVLLERCKIQPEPKADKANVFSIALQDDPECKYYFACRSHDECTDWLTALRNASYENMRSNMLLLQNKLSRQTGQQRPQHGHISAAR